MILERVTARNSLDNLFKAGLFFWTIFLKLNNLKLLDGLLTIHSTVTLNAEIQVFHTGYLDFFHLCYIYIFCVALASTKHE